jgi:hypothetical protein
MTCPLPDHPELRFTMKQYVPILNKCSLIIWSLFMLYKFSSLAYPHKAYLFHLHTVAATVLICVATYSIIWSTQAKDIKLSPSERNELLQWHRYAMFLSATMTFIVSFLMIAKKSWYGELPILLFQRAPSYHSTVALIWFLIIIPSMCFSGMIIHRTEPPNIVKSLAKMLFGSTNAKKTMRSAHKKFGFVGWCSLMLTAILGLVEKNDDSTKHSLGWVLGGIMLLMFAQDRIMKE